MAVIGLDLGGTKLAGALFEHNGEIIFEETLPLLKRSGKEVGDLIKELVQKLISYAEGNGISVNAIGACVPGISYSKTGRVWAPNIPGWEDYSLLEDLKLAVGSREIEIKIDSDRACSILGEAWIGAAKGCRDVIFLAVGTGIGAGIMIDGNILRGHQDIAGAIGWLALDRPFKEKYISCGCFEYHASGDGIAKVTKEYLSRDNSYNGILKQKKIDDITAHDVFEAFEQNDQIAKKVLNEAIEFWGMTAANLVSLFNPEKIIFGGGVFGPAVRFLDNIMIEARKWAQPISINQVKFEGSMLGGRAGLYGGGYLALRILEK
jgi:glucokinase